ncbi:MAG: TetR/AcrR family transcriptional regulator [Allosphingosinicella sp.]
MAAAWEEFKAHGFERTSMAQISERVGGSKATLYSYFSSKEELFAAALAQAIKERADRILDQMDDEGDLADRLVAFARGYMETRLAPEMIEADRVMISEADRSDLGVKLRTGFILPEWRRLAAAISHEMDAGHLRPSDPYPVAMHFRGLIEGDLLERRLHGEPTITPEELDAAVVSGAEAFLRAYSTGGQQDLGPEPSKINCT